ncbi:hypothetical protein EIP86_010888 [Pleurotus ostreatoroseus]|nr:hypothetical protein EIP86_010888 [Pleurotus ostreatoroseus]
MPASRLSTRRRKSSLGLGLSLAKAGTYGLTSPRPVTFAPNVTPGTYVEDVDGDDTDDTPSPTDTLFPPAAAPEPTPSRRRVPPGKRRSQGYIPRPPNAFMLFRADFVRQKHVPGSIETNHGSLSKIIGNIWTNLSPEQKEPWNKLAKKKKAEHKQMYPNYRFRPVHNKNKNAAKRKEKPLPDPTDEARCEQVAQLLLDGKKGAELTAAVRQLDYTNNQDWSSSMTPPPPYAAFAAPTPIYAQRRPSSVPPPTTLYNPISIPTVPFLPPWQHPSASRPDSPVGNIARANRYMLGQRRASSTGPTYYGTWNTPQSYIPIPIEQLQRDDEPLPDVNAGLFNTSFGFGMEPSQTESAFSDPANHTNLALSISPLDHVDPLADPLASASTTLSSAYPYDTATPADVTVPTTMPWMQQQFNELHVSESVSPSAFTPSPCSVPTEMPVVGESSVAVYAPQPEHAQGFQGWEAMQHPAAVHMEDVAPMHADMSLGLHPMEYHVDMHSSVNMSDYTCAYDDSTPMEGAGYDFSNGYAQAFESQQF